MSDGERQGDAAVTVLRRDRSLVFVDRRKGPRVARQPAADFVVQLIACEQHLGAFRRARREEPAAGLRRYQPKALAAVPEFERSV